MEIPPGLPDDLVRALVRAATEKDSLEIGAPSKGGSVKIYFDLNDLDAAKEKIRNAAEARKFAQDLLGVAGGP